MKEAFEKIIEKLKRLKTPCELGMIENGRYVLRDKAIEIVKQAATEYATDTNVGTKGWIPVSERLPEEAFGCLVTFIDYEPSTQTDFDNILPYFVGYDGHRWNDADGEEIPFEVIAWQPLPEPYQPKGE